MDLMPRTFDDYLRDRRARVAAWLEQRTEAETATAVCERWIADLLARDLMLYSRQDIGSLPADLNLVDRLTAEKLEGLSEALSWQIDDAEGREPDEAALIGHALAAASGHTYAIRGPGKLDWIGHFVASIYGPLWEDFADSAAEALGKNPNALEAFVDFLAAIVTRANDAPDTVTEIPPRRASMASMVEQFARTGTFQDVWDSDLVPVLFGPSDSFEILRRADPQRFAKMIDELPHPSLVKQCLCSKALRESLQDVLMLLRLARPAFHTEGDRRCCGMAAILLLQLASEQLLSEPDDESVGDLNQGIATFSDNCRGVLEVVFARSDGVKLAWYWLENLVRQNPRVSPPRRSAPRTLIINRIGILANAISSRLAPRRDQDAWIAEAAPLARQFRAVAVLSVTAFATVPDLDVGNAAKGLLKGSGFELTRASELINLPGAPLRTIPGDALARIPNIASWFASSWTALRFERERAWRPKGSDRSNPAEIMGLWGLGVIESLMMSTPVKQRDAAAMWSAVERVFREARLVEPRLGRDFWTEAVARLFRWWPQIFLAVEDIAGDQAKSFAPAALGGVLTPYAEISGDFMAVIVSLQQGGLAPSMLDGAARGARLDILRMIHRFLETARRLDDRRVWNPDWVAVLRRAETEIAQHRASTVSRTETGLKGA